MIDKAIARLDKQNTATQILIVLLITDVVLILVFLSHRLLGWPSSHLFNIGIDRSIPEYFQYLKELALSAVLFALFLRERSIAALLWSVLAAVLLVDDAFQVHEKFGSMIDGVFYFAGCSWHSRPGLRRGDRRRTNGGTIIAWPRILLFSRLRSGA